MEREQAFDAPHLLPCGDCGAANGLNALRCWNCVAELPGARQCEQTPLVQPLPATGMRRTRTRRTKPRARRRVGTAIAVAVVLVLATFVWTPPSPPLESEGARAPGPVAAPAPPPRMSAADASDPPPTNRDEAVRALGLEQRQHDGAETAPNRKGCEPNDLAAGLCAAASPPAESAPAEPAPEEPAPAEPSAAEQR